MNKPLTLKGRILSFKYAGQGVWLTIKSQHNAWIHAVATIVVVIAGFALRISKIEWCVIILTCTAVWTAEALNTALEFLADAVSKETHPVIGQAKDVAAGAVLITAFGALIVGVLVFGPHILVLLNIPR
jgi:diacylglycerol kinase (ATP)